MQGSTDAGLMWKKYIAPGLTGETYIRWYQKWGEVFVFNPQEDQKLLMIHGLNPPDEWGQTSDWKTYIHLIGTTNGSRPNQLYIDHLIWTGPDQWDGIWSGFPQNVGVPYGFRTGKWECIEVMIRPNTVGKIDGAIKLWINGLLKMDYANIQIRSNDTPLNAIQVTGWYTGGAPDTQYSWIDDIVVSDQYIGLMPQPDSVPPAPPDALKIIN